MIFVGLFFAYVTLLSAGFGATLLLYRGKNWLNLIECLCLAWLFGSAIVSLLLWTFGLLFSGSLLALLVTVCCLALGWTGWMRAHRRQVSFSVDLPRELFDWILLIVLIAEIALVYGLALKRPLGWDGLLVWEAKARFAFLSSNVLPVHYHTAARTFTHPEYPLGLPFTELWFYIWMGEPHQLWVKSIFATFYASGVGLLAILCGRLTGSSRLGLGMAILFFLVPTEIGGLGSAASGYADFPLSVFYFAAIAYLLLWWSDRADYNFRIFAFCLACLPWFKREGMILWATGAVLGAIAILLRRRARLWRLTALLPGLIVATGWNLYLNVLHLEMPSEFLPVSLSTLSKNGGRLQSICGVLFEEMMKFNAWGIFWFLAAIAIIYLSTQARRISRVALLLAAIVPLAAYCFIYVFSNAANYVVHINLSLPRLLMHVVPVFWLVISLAVALPWQFKNSSESALADLQES